MSWMSSSHQVAPATSYKPGSTRFAWPCTTMSKRSPAANGATRLAKLGRCHRHAIGFRRVREPPVEPYGARERARLLLPPIQIGSGC